MATIDPHSPVFVLCGVVYKQDDYLSHDLPNMTRLKMELWGHDSFVLHSHGIRKRLGPFKQLKDDHDFDQSLVKGIAKFFVSSTSTIVAAAVDKVAHKLRYVTPYDPYELTLTFCLERLYLNLPANDINGMVCVFESRGKSEDKILEAWFLRICSGKNALNKQLPFQCCFASKQQNLVGLQVADLAAYPIAKHVHRPNVQRLDWRAVRPKIYRNGNGEINGYGLKIFP